MSIVTGLRRYKVQWSSKERYCPNIYFLNAELFVCYSLNLQELDKIVEYELKIGGVLLHPTFSGGKEKDK